MNPDMDTDPDTDIHTKSQTHRHGHRQTDGRDIRAHPYIQRDIDTQHTALICGLQTHAADGPPMTVVSPRESWDEDTLFLLLSPPLSLCFVLSQQQHCFERLLASACLENVCVSVCIPVNKKKLLGVGGTGVNIPPHARVRGCLSVTSLSFSFPFSCLLVLFT